MASVNDPVRSMDRTGLPPPSHFQARDGSLLAYRGYAPAAGSARGSVVLVHGSSASSLSMHAMASAFADAGFAAYALDMRGHGDSGARGQIDYIGQLEHDLEDFVRRVAPPAPATLVGFSAGGGFAIRFAGSERQDLFGSYLLLSPFVSQDAPTYRPGGGGWVQVGIPRIVALTVLDTLGVRALHGLPVTRFALNAEAQALLTPSYSFALATNFRPQADYQGNLRAMRQPARLIAGTADEAFVAQAFEDVARSAARPIPVQLLPQVGHAGLILEPQAIAAALAAVATLQATGSRAAP
ncbi:MAG: alpha/beta fold hydrolase [Rubrivivax sp.]|nr:alpha/beta fold hydrolase [Rubrivivax sp.]